MSFQRLPRLGYLLVAGLVLQLCMISVLPATASASRSMRADRDHDGLCEANGGAHCDAIQLQGGGATSITGNYLKTGETFILAPDGSSNVAATNNVFDGTGVSYLDKIRLGPAANPIFRHNTLRNVRASFDSMRGYTASSNVQAKDNVMVGSGTSWKTSNGNGCSGCTFSYNLFDDSGDASGSNNLIGTPSFTGGSNPSNYAGFKLTGGSLGTNASSDGNDMGALIP